MSIFGTLKGIATEVFDLSTSKVHMGPPTPRTPIESVSLGRDHNGYSVYEIKAKNYAIAAEPTDGYTVEGPVHKSLTHVGHNKWQARVECNDTEVRR